MYNDIQANKRDHMNGKEVHKSKITKKEETNQKPFFNYVVSEGTQVLLDARDFVKDMGTTHSIKDYLWNPPVGTHLNIDDSIKNDRTILLFTAPYVKDNDINTTLSFKLTVSSKGDDEEENSPYDVNVVVKRVHRAIIFQGGVALGAYEAGAYQAIVQKLVKIEEKKRKDLEGEKRPLFEIVAGASIGAMNGAIVVSNVTDGKNLEDIKNWEYSTEKVIEFW